MNFGMNNALEVQLRGDGRAYILNLQPSSVNEEDLYQAALYTRGGPHWQTIHVRIRFLAMPNFLAHPSHLQLPLSDFLLTYMGYVQNDQLLVSPEKIRTVGILLADRIDGPFTLDIKSIRAIYMRKELANMDAIPVPDGDQGS